ncbi:MAG: DUF1080 domain-containing protein [Fuerstiella sp.]
MMHLRNLIRSPALPALMMMLPSALGDKPETEPGFVSMFNGENLEGWTVMPEREAKAWSVKDGLIIGVGGPVRSHLIWHNPNIADFEMKLGYRFPGEGNSGVNVRARTDDTGKRDFQAYHVDFGHAGIGPNILGAWDFHTPGRTEHRCFRGDRLVIDENDNATITPIDNAVTLNDIRDKDWNDVHIIVRDNHFQYFINGRPASEFTEHLPPERRLPAGMIQLQLHDPGMVVHFKNIRLKILK